MFIVFYLLRLSCYSDSWVLPKVLYVHYIYSIVTIHDFKMLQYELNFFTRLIGTTSDHRSSTAIVLTKYESVLHSL